MFDDIVPTFTLWQMALKIYLLRNKSGTHQIASSIAKRIDLSSTNPMFNRLLADLIECGAIDEVGRIGRSRILKINHKLLEQILTNCKIYEEGFERFAKAALPGSYIIP